MMEAKKQPNLHLDNEREKVASKYMSQTLNVFESQASAVKRPRSGVPTQADSEHAFKRHSSNYMGYNPSLVKGMRPESHH